MRMFVQTPSGKHLAHSHVLYCGVPNMVQFPYFSIQCDVARSRTLDLRRAHRDAVSGDRVCPRLEEPDPQASSIVSRHADWLRATCLPEESRWHRSGYGVYSPFSCDLLDSAPSSHLLRRLARKSCPQWPETSRSHRPLSADSTTRGANDPRLLLLAIPANDANKTFHCHNLSHLRI